MKKIGICLDKDITLKDVQIKVSMILGDTFPYLSCNICGEDNNHNKVCNWYRIGDYEYDLFHLFHKEECKLPINKYSILIDENFNDQKGSIWILKKYKHEYMDMEKKDLELLKKRIKLFFKRCF